MSQAFLFPEQQLEPEISMRNVLVIVQDFPPYGGGPVIRTHKFVKYLPENGWRPIVLTLDPRYYLDTGAGHDLLAELRPEVVIHRTRALRLSHASRERLKARGAKGTQLTSSGPRGGVTGRLVQWKRWLYRTLLTQGDEAYGWLIPALHGAHHLLYEHPIDLIYTTSPPHPVHLIGAMLAWQRGLPWVTDFRDGWTSMPFFRAGWVLRRWLDQQLERYVLSHADRIIVTTSAVGEEFRALHGTPLDRFQIIPNGFDSADFSVPAEPAHHERFRIVYTGVLSWDRTPRYFFEALARWQVEEPGLASCIEVVLAGHLFAENQAMIDEMGLNDLVSYRGMLPHMEAVHLMRSADLLLLIVIAEDQGTALIPGKSYEYIASGRPVLAMVSESVVADLIRESCAGFVVDPHDVDAILDHFRRAYAAWEAGMPWQGAAIESAHRYDRRTLAASLAKLFDAIVASPNRSTLPSQHHTKI